MAAVFSAFGRISRHSKQKRHLNTVCGFRDIFMEKNEKEPDLQPYNAYVVHKELQISQMTHTTWWQSPEQKNKGLRHTQ